MTITEAIAVNKLWFRHLGKPDASGRAITEEDVLDAFETLAKNAFKALGAGVRIGHVRAQRILYTLETVKRRRSL